MPNYHFWHYVDVLMGAMGPMMLASLAILIGAISYDVDARRRADEEADDE
jgi:hypothetical protein